MQKFILISEFTEGGVAISSFKAANKKAAEEMAETNKRVNLKKIERFILIEAEESKDFIRRVFAAAGRANRDEEQNN